VNIVVLFKLLNFYEFVTISGWNIIFIRKELFPLLNTQIVNKDKIITDYTNDEGYLFWRSKIVSNNDMWAINEIF